MRVQLTTSVLLAHLMSSFSPLRLFDTPASVLKICTNNYNGTDINTNPNFPVFLSMLCTFLLIFPTISEELFQDQTAEYVCAAPIHV